MLLISEDALFLCGHMGRVQVPASQQWVTVKKRPLLVATDPEGRSISLCPNLAAGKPCTSTVGVGRGYSQWLRVDGHAACRADLVGITDGMPPGAASYGVTRAGQEFVSENP